MSGRAPRIVLAFLVLLLLGLWGAPWAVREYWTARSTNSVRRGVARARKLGCFSCHGDLGRAGIKDPGVRDLEVPGWSGGVSMMYVSHDEDIRRYILKGSAPNVDSRESLAGGSPRAAIAMPSFKQVLRGSDLEDLVAAFKILSGRSVPPADTPEERGHQVAQSWGCFSCHGPGGSGGLPNPGSFTGFVPGWYGYDFKDLVRGREEFNTWIREGGIPRLSRNPISARFIRRQRIQMPRYKNLQDEQMNHLWAYAGWLARTGGGTETP